MSEPYRSWADLGGTLGRGAVVPEPEGELWHASWEPRVLALVLAAGGTGAWTIDQNRAARETLPDYASRSYYEIWEAGLERLLADRGIVHADELDAGRSLHPAPPPARVLTADRVDAALAAGSPYTRQPAAPSRFEVGDRVRTRGDVALHHTRLPGYARGKVGTVERVHGAHVFADTNAHGLGEEPQWLYTVVFGEDVLWGDDDRERVAGQHLSVSIDAWEPYLEPA